MVDRQSECQEMVVGSTPKCAAIDEERYQVSATHLRLPHSATCPNVGALIPDTDGNVRNSIQLVQAICDLLDDECELVLAAAGLQALGGLQLERMHSHVRHAEEFRDSHALQGNMGKYEWGQQSSSSAASGRGHSARHAWLWLFVVLLGGFAAGALCVYGPEQVREAGAAASEAVVSCVLWLIDGARSLMRRAQGHNPEDLGFERLADSQQDSLYAVP